MARKLSAMALLCLGVAAASASDMGRPDDSFVEVSFMKNKKKELESQILTPHTQLPATSQEEQEGAPVGAESLASDPAVAALTSDLTIGAETPLGGAAEPTPQEDENPVMKLFRQVRQLFASIRRRLE